MHFTQFVYVLIVLPIIVFTDNVQFNYKTDLSSNEALKNLHSISLFLRFPAGSPDEENLFKQQMLQELKKHGSVQERSLFVDTPKGKALDISMLPNTQATMIFETLPLIDANGKELSITRAALSIICETEIDSTKEKVSSIVWSRTYYFPQKIKSDGPEFKRLMEDFSTSYKIANPKESKKINFYLLEG